MGLVYGFHSLDPAVVRRLIGTSTKDLIEELKARAILPEDVGSDSWTNSTRTPRYYTWPPRRSGMWTSR